MWYFRDKALVLGSVQVGCESPTREGGINLERRRKHSVAKSQARASYRLRRFLDALAEIVQEFLEVQFLVLLRGVVRGPDLGIGRTLDCFCDSDRAGAHFIPILITFTL